MSFPKYEAYKDSGVEWLGEVPKHWNIAQTKRCFRRLKQVNTGMICDNRLALTMNGVVPRDIDDLDGLQSSDYEGYQIFEAGDLAFKLIDLQNIKTSRVGLTPERGIMSPAYIRLSPTHGCNVRYAYWYFMALYWNQVFNNLGGGVRQTIGPEELITLPLPIPTQSEQASIVAFVDRETTKIDTLVQEQQRLIELLKEKRQAVMSHAVTKGLNPDAPMKDSGVEWLGEVPGHWSCVQLGRLCTQVSDGPHFSPHYVDEGVMFISARNIKVDGWSLDDAKYVSEDDYAEFCRRVTPEIGDILYTKGGTTGIARVVDLKDRFQVWVHVAVIKLVKSVADPYYVAYALNSSGCYEQSQLFTRGATNQDLGLTRMIKIWLALPPSDEQEAIVTHLNEQTHSLDQLIKEAEAAITLLQERRSALISAAVTGKIDVRDLVSVEAEAA